MTQNLERNRKYIHLVIGESPFSEININDVNHEPLERQLAKERKICTPFKGKTYLIEINNLRFYNIQNYWSLNSQNDVHYYDFERNYNKMEEDVMFVIKNIDVKFNLKTGRDPKNNIKIFRTYRSKKSNYFYLEHLSMMNPEFNAYDYSNIDFERKSYNYINIINPSKGVNVLKEDLGTDLEEELYLTGIHIKNKLISKFVVNKFQSLGYKIKK